MFSFYLVHITYVYVYMCVYLYVCAPRHSASNVSRGDEGLAMAQLKRQMILLQIENEKLKRAKHEPLEAAPEPAPNPTPERPALEKKPTAKPKPALVDPSLLETQLVEEGDEEGGEAEEDQDNEEDEEEDDEGDLDGEPLEEGDQDQDADYTEDSETEAVASVEELQAEEERAREAIMRLEMEAREARERLQEIEEGFQKVKPSEVAKSEASGKKAPSALALALKQGAAEYKLKRAEARSNLSVPTTASTKSNPAQAKATPMFDSANDLPPTPAAMLDAGPARCSATIEPEKINTSTHKVAWAKLDRLMNSGKASEFPHMVQLFNGRQAALWFI